MNKLWKLHHNRKYSIEWHFDCITRHYLERYFPEKFGPALTINVVQVIKKKDKVNRYERKRNEYIQNIKSI